MKSHVTKQSKLRMAEAARAKEEFRAADDYLLFAKTAHVRAAQECAETLVGLQKALMRYCDAAETVRRHSRR